MIRKWVKILPYWVIIKMLKNFGGNVGTFGNDNCLYFRIDKGEFIVFDKANYTLMSKNQKEQRESKVQKQLRKLNKKLSKDYDLKKELQEQFEEEKRQEAEDINYS